MCYCYCIMFDHLSLYGNGSAVWYQTKPKFEGLQTTQHTLHSSPRAKGKCPSRCSSPQQPPDMELKTMVLTSPQQSKRGLKCMAMFSELWPMLMAKLQWRQEHRGEKSAMKKGRCGWNSNLSHSTLWTTRTVHHLYSQLTPPPIQLPNSTYSVILCCHPVYNYVTVYEMRYIRIIT